MKGEKEVIEKLFNSLGKKVIKQFYDLDLNFEVIGSLENSPLYYPEKMIIVKSDKPIPNVLKVPNHSFEWGKFATKDDLRYNLEHLFKYLNKDWGVILNPDEPDRRLITFSEEEGNIENTQRFLSLLDGSYALDKISGYVYAVFNNGTLDVDSAYHLSEIDSEEFWDELTPQEIKELDSLY